MTRVRRWKVAAIASGALVALLVAAAVATDAWSRATESTYYGRHTNLLQVGERVAFTEDFRAAGGQRIAKAQTCIVQEEPAWDEDSCDPDRPIRIALTSGEVISVPRHVLHRG